MDKSRLQNPLSGRVMTHCAEKTNGLLSQSILGVLVVLSGDARLLIRIGQNKVAYTIGLRKEVRKEVNERLRIEQLLRSLVFHVKGFWERNTHRTAEIIAYVGPSFVAAFEFHEHVTRYYLRVKR